MDTSKRTSHTETARSRGRPREFDMDEALDKAIDIFREQGFHATSINDLSSGMGLTAGSIYKAFKDKRDVFLAALDRYMEVRNRQLRERLEAARPASNACMSCCSSMRSHRMMKKVCADA